MKRGNLRSIASVGALNLFFIALCFVTLIPILYALSVALSAQNTLLSSDFSFIPRALTLDNFRAVFEGEDVLLWFENSMVLAAATVALSLSAAIPAAYAFAILKFRGAGIFFLLVLMRLMISPESTMSKAARSER